MVQSLSLAELSSHLANAGLANEVRGDASVIVRGCNTLEGATEGEITFLANPRYRDHVRNSRASAIIMRDDATLSPPMPQIVCEDPYRGLTMAVVKLHGFRRHPNWCNGQEGERKPDGFVDPSATIGEGANIAPGATICADVRIGRNLVIYPGVFVGPRCRIGDDVTLYPGVTIYEGCSLGDRVCIHAGTVIGEDGLGYAPVDGGWQKIPQAGSVVIEDDVEIGANCTIDRATLGTTRIGAGSKFSNMVAIGHGCQVGPDCLFVAQVGIAGSVRVGRHVTIAGQAGIVGHLNIGDNANICAKAGVSASVEPGQTVLGAPATPVNEARKQMIAVQRLPALRRQVRDMTRQIEELRVQIERMQTQADRAEMDRAEMDRAEMDRAEMDQAEMDQA